MIIENCPFPTHHTVHVTIQNAHILFNRFIKSLFGAQGPNMFFLTLKAMLWEVAYKFVSCEMKF